MSLGMGGGGGMEFFNMFGCEGGRETHSRSELVFVDLPPFKKPRNRFRGIEFARLGIDSWAGHPPPPTPPDRARICKRLRS